ncbi:helix-turn-helix domain-containing protein [Brachybacterium sp. YJGR34]|uniref:helix-turn-helix domain-containing protein n=1 Tax=Brachybacterium sp. YJGR34 TaxID=2059911 RepID=UPI000E0B7C5D|nr:helix-turn-helix domain-containing protein [Brachybacterium sp. YJGR34]
MSGGMRPAVVAQLGERIRAARQELDLSVGALAELSDVSRRMLTQIELGQANPSVALLDRVAAGLGTTFAALMGMGADAPPDGVEVWSTENGSWAVLLDAMGSAGVSVESWRWKLVGGDVYRAEAGGLTQGIMLHVVEGALEIGSAAGERIIEAGGSGRSGAGEGYTYRARDEQGAVFFAVALLPRDGRPQEVERANLSA